MLDSQSGAESNRPEPDNIIGALEPPSSTNSTEGTVRGDLPFQVDMDDVVVREEIGMIW